MPLPLVLQPDVLTHKRFAIWVAIREAESVMAARRVSVSRACAQRAEGPGDCARRCSALMGYAACLAAESLLGVFARCPTACHLATLWNNVGLSPPRAGFGGEEGPAFQGHAVATRLLRNWPIRVRWQQARSRGGECSDSCDGSPWHGLSAPTWCCSGSRPTASIGHDEH